MFDLAKIPIIPDTTVADNEIFFLDNAGFLLQRVDTKLGQRPSVQTLVSVKAALVSPGVYRKIVDRRGEKEENDK